MSGLSPVAVPEEDGRGVEDQIPLSRAPDRSDRSVPLTWCEGSGGLPWLSVKRLRDRAQSRVS